MLRKLQQLIATKLNHSETIKMSLNSSPTGQHQQQQGIQQKDGGPIFVMQSMSSGGSQPTNYLHERYMSNESLENDRNSTTSSTESPNSSGIQHRKVTYN